jgi:ATP synthase F1 epsilon subunit
METTFKLTIQTPDQIRFEGDVASVLLETEGGQIKILPQHVHAMGSILFSEVRIEHGNQEEVYFVRNGIIKVDNESNEVSLLAFDVEKKDELTHASIKEYMDFVVDALENDEDLADIQVQYLKDQRASLDRLLNITQE